jgi:YidC/Oxa1 family membrane protein insertase
MGQQFYVIRNNPAPNTEAFRAKQKRDAEKARRHGETPAEGTDEGAGGAVASPESSPGTGPSAPQRQQPKRQSRSQRKGGGKQNPPGQKPPNKE